MILLLIGALLLNEGALINNSQTNAGNIFKDPRDGKEYKTVKIGRQIWMAQNLNYVTDKSWCQDCDTYGRMYTFQDAMNACPPGWHIPTDEEWKELINYLGGASVAGGKLKSKEHWNSPNIGATNSSGFSGIPAHYRTVDGKIRDAGRQATWWSSSIGPDPAVWTWNLYNDKVSIESLGFYNNSGFSVRCVKN
jgi:uncharacterized protein (TIGR02145 family)